jgi:hypothetical protein
MIDLRISKSIQGIQTEIDNAYERARKNLGFDK